MSAEYDQWIKKYVADRKKARRKFFRSLLARASKCDKWTKPVERIK